MSHDLPVKSITYENEFVQGVHLTVTPPEGLRGWDALDKCRDLAQEAVGVRQGINWTISDIKYEAE